MAGLSLRVNMTGAGWPGAAVGAPRCPASTDPVGFTFFFFAVLLSKDASKLTSSWVKSCRGEIALVSIRFITAIS